MLGVLLVTVGLATTPTPVKLALPDVQAVNLDVKVATFLGEHFAQQLKMTGIDVVTSREISSVLGLERQKQVLGCASEGNTCMTELANALGADGVILTDLAKLGTAIRITGCVWTGSPTTAMNAGTNNNCNDWMGGGNLAFVGDPSDSARAFSMQMLSCTQMCSFYCLQTIP